MEYYSIDRLTGLKTQTNKLTIDKGLHTIVKEEKKKVRVCRCNPHSVEITASDNQKTKKSPLSEELVQTADQT